MMKMKSCVVLMVIMALVMVEMSMAFQCGRQARGVRCAKKMCCSQYGYCGTTAKYCGRGCQSQCRGREGEAAADDEQAEQVHPFSTDVLQSRKIPTDAHVADGANTGTP